MSRLAERLRQGIDPNDIPDAEAIMDTAADEIDRLRGALQKIANGTEDAEPPYRAINAGIMGQIARDALNPR